MNAINYEQKGVVFNMQRYSVHDGPGIRTIVFIKGCPLHCRWCSNPESQRMMPNIMFEAAKCIGCGRCMQACKNGALSKENRFFVDRTKCKTCGECVAVCPTGALTIKGKYMTVAEVVKELKKDAGAFRRSGGGVTLSGGEGLVQHEFTTEILKACQAQGWSTAFETTGYADPKVIEEVFPHVNHTLLDIKSMNPTKHKEQTGVDNALILENARRIAELSQVTVRVPVIPGFNYSEEDIRAIGTFAKTLPHVDTVHLLPYHALGSNKYEMVGRTYEMETLENLKHSEVTGLAKIITDMGLNCVIGG